MQKLYHLQLLKSQPIQENTFDKAWVPGSSSSVILNFLADLVAVLIGYLFHFRLSLRTATDNIVCSTLRDFPFQGRLENQHNFHWKSEQQPFITKPNSSFQIACTYLLSQIIISTPNSELFLLNWFLFFKEYFTVFFLNVAESQEHGIL